jgi:hypothetical protein
MTHVRCDTCIIVTGKNTQEVWRVTLRFDGHIAPGCCAAQARQDPTNQPTQTHTANMCYLPQLLAATTKHPTGCWTERYWGRLGGCYNHHQTAHRVATKAVECSTYKSCSMLALHKLKAAGGGRVTACNPGVNGGRQMPLRRE